MHHSLDEDLVAKGVQVCGLATALDVNEQNEGAVRFYAARGFAEVGRSPLDGEGRPFPLLHLRRG